jgi:hypothetical protein
MNSEVRNIEALIGFIVLVAYVLLTILVYTKCKTNIITILSVIIFALHQYQTFTKFDPISDASKQPIFRAESLV